MRAHTTQGFEYGPRGLDTFRRSPAAPLYAPGPRCWAARVHGTRTEVPAPRDTTKLPVFPVRAVGLHVEFCAHSLKEMML